jgi:hypothetical protein
MSEEIGILRHELEKVITVSHLQAISVDIINRFRQKDHEALLEYARINNLDEKTPVQRLFATLIQKYHPDKFAGILREIDSSAVQGRLDLLLQMKKSYVCEIFPKRESDSVHEQNDERYEYADEDFGYHESYTDEEISDKPDEEDDNEIRYFDEERNFTEAVNDYFFGNLDYTVTVSDLKNIDGDLDLSERNIAHLKGIEYCEYLTSLNLSGNNIDRIDRLSRLTRLTVLFISGNRIETINALAGMKELTELDISDNCIENISVLLELEGLLYVNLMNNPIQDRSVVDELVRRGVVVIL